MDSSWDMNGTETTSVYRFYHDEKGRNYMDSAVGGTQLLLYSVRREFDAQDRVARETTLLMSIVQFTAWTYTSSGKPAGKVVTDSLGRVNSRWTGEYDGEGRLMRESEYNNPGDVPSSTLVHRYGGDTLVDTTYRYHDEGALAWRRICTYENGRKTLVKTVVVEGEGSEDAYRYRPDGKLEGETRSVGGKPWWTVRYEYDAGGKVLRITWEFADSLFPTTVRHYRWKKAAP